MAKEKKNTTSDDEPKVKSNYGRRSTLFEAADKIKTKKKEKQRIARNKKRNIKNRRGSKIDGLDEKFHRDYNGQDVKKEVHPMTRPDPEKAAAPKDGLEKLKYPPPKNDPIFRRIWSQHIDNISSRENFKVGHLNQLEILCDLHVRYENLQEFIRTHGMTYESFGRNGYIVKTYPQVSESNKCIAQIKEYNKLLGLLLKGDKSEGADGEEDEWK